MAGHPFLLHVNAYSVSRTRWDTTFTAAVIASARRCHFLFPSSPCSELWAHSFAFARPSARGRICLISASPGRSQDSWLPSSCCFFPRDCRGPRLRSRPRSRFNSAFRLIFYVTHGLLAALGLAGAACRWRVRNCIRWRSRHGWECSPRLSTCFPAANSMAATSFSRSRRARTVSSRCDHDSGIDSAGNFFLAGLADVGSVAGAQRLAPSHGSGVARGEWSRRWLAIAGLCDADFNLCPGTDPPQLHAGSIREFRRGQ